MLLCQHIPCVDPFSGCNVHVAEFSNDEYRALGRGSILSDAVGVDGLAYLPSLLMLLLLDGLKPYLL